MVLGTCRRVVCLLPRILSSLEWLVTGAISLPDIQAQTFGLFTKFLDWFWLFEFYRRGIGHFWLSTADSWFNAASGPASELVLPLAWAARFVGSQCSFFTSSFSIVSIWPSFISTLDLKLFEFFEFFSILHFIDTLCKSLDLLLQLLLRLLLQVRGAQRIYRVQLGEYRVHYYRIIGLGWRILSRILDDLHFFMRNLQRLDLGEFLGALGWVAIGIDGGERVHPLTTTPSLLLLICRNGGSLKNCVRLIVGVIHLATAHARHLVQILLGHYWRNWVEIRLQLPRREIARALKTALGHVLGVLGCLRLAMKLSIDIR